MSRSEIFFAPGEWLVTFALSLFDRTPQDMPPGLFWGLSLIATLGFWVQVIKIAVAVVRRITGFERQVQR